MFYYYLGLALRSAGAIWSSVLLMVPPSASSGHP